MKIRKARLIEWILIGTILGYPLVAGLSASFNFQNSLFSLVVRSMIAFMALLLLVEGVGEFKYAWRKILIILITFFFLAYLARLVYSTLIETDGLSESWLHYWMWTIGSAVLPVFGLAIARDREVNWLGVQITFLKIALLAGIFVALNASSTVTNVFETYDSGRFRLDTLNPISLGHLGVSLLIVSAMVFMFRKNFSKFNVLLSVFGIGLGGFLMVVSNSRGPLVSIVCAFIFGMLAMQGKRKIWAVSVFILLLMVSSSFLAWLEMNFGIATYSRVFGGELADDVNVLGRLHLYSLAFNSVMTNPVFGSGIEVDGLGVYPHNVSIEAFLSVGVLGGLIFLLVEILSIVVIFRVGKRDSRLIWVGMIIVQYIVAAQFSGAIYSSTALWCSIGLAIYCGKYLHVRRNTDSVDQKRLSFL